MKIYEVFNSVDGEVNRYGQGTFSTFIRTAGCNLRCSYCDTSHSQNPDAGEDIPVEEVIERVKVIGCPKVTITGGEPLLQRTALENLVFGLLSIGINKITIETNGSYHLLNKGNGVSWVVDFKTPGSGMLRKEKDQWVPIWRYEETKGLGPEDYLKFVIVTEEDYEFSKQWAERIRGYGAKCKMAFSPAFGNVIANELVRKMKRDKLWNIQLNVQLHKFLGVR